MLLICNESVSYSSIAHNYYADPIKHPIQRLVHVKLSMLRTVHDDIIVIAAARRRKSVFITGKFEMGRILLRMY